MTRFDLAIFSNDNTFYGFSAVCIWTDDKFNISEAALEKARQKALLFLRVSTASHINMADEFDYDLILDDLDPFADNTNTATENTTYDPLGPTNAGSKRSADDEAGQTDTKRRKERTRLKPLDADLLLSANGLSKIRHQAPWIQFQGKGFEDSDLRKLMEFYQMWAHKLYPRLRYKDFVEKAYKACTHARCKVTLAEWQDEYYQSKRKPDDLVSTELSGMTLEDEENERRQVSDDDTDTSEDETVTRQTPQSSERVTDDKDIFPEDNTGHDHSSSDNDEPLFASTSREPSTSSNSQQDVQAKIRANREAALAKLAARRKAAQASKEQEP
ncbi:replication fork protection component Swi3-domain-containing protein [Radiomyces spectabilis]|uniref:replication fork protection component Swi3-domain-containing protein n=1 Tax=Radiomyces spectabilis TaxID=64574 RepID=UPI00221E9539|nr:replication fork protection component Swi3-domain-containing protein [Radiomyces spectabilis]KAI8380890.1 replication fork protection component Swi3-domain-containing protein [Radiomyces spectabilis]